MDLFVFFIMSTFQMLDVLDFVPVVGAVKNGIEAGIHFSDGNSDEGTSKAVQAVFGGVLDIVTFGVGGTVVKIGGKAMAKVASKVVAIETSKLGTKVAINTGVKLVGTGVKLMGKGGLKVGAVVAAATTKTIGQSHINKYTKDNEGTQTQSEEGGIQTQSEEGGTQTQSDEGGTQTQSEDGGTQKQSDKSSKKDTKGNKKQRKGKKDEDEQKKNPDKDDQKKGGNGNDGTSRKDPKRGDHVINNAILSLYGDIIETFLTTQGLSYRDDQNTLPQEIVSYHDSPLPVDVMHNIGDRLVILETVIGGTNHETYGIHNLGLITATVRYMQLLTLREIDPEDYRVNEIKKQQKYVRDKVVDMINDNAFVDEAALKLLPSDQLKSYNDAREKTAEMLRELIELAQVWVKLMCTAKDMKKLSGRVTYVEDTDSDGIHYQDPSWKNDNKKV